MTQERRSTEEQIAEALTIELAEGQGVVCMMSREEGDHRVFFQRGQPDAGVSALLETACAGGRTAFGFQAGCTTAEAIHGIPEVIQGGALPEEIERVVLVVPLVGG